MSDLHPSSDNTAQAASSGFLFHDWNLSDKGTTTEISQFDGKIIARMPDLGSECLSKNIEITKSSSFWNKMGASIASMIQGTPATRQHFLRHCTAVGSVVLLCGMGFLLLERKSEPTEIVSDITENVSTSTEMPLIESVVVVGESEKFSPVMPPGDIISPPVIPGGPIDVSVAMPPPVNDSTYSPWGVAARQPESQIPESAPPPVAVAMAPMVDMSAPMPVSPYEQQLYAQPHAHVPPSNMPPNMPLDPFAQTNTGVTQGVAPPQNVQRPISPPLHPQYVPQSAVQNVYGQPGHPNPHVPPNTPIPSGVSTLPQQGGYPPPHHSSGVPLHAPRQSNDFYYAPPSSSYRRVY
jgi:hypothetical protein